jgi:hypothetical protein
MAVEEELDAPGVTWTGVAADPAEGVPVAELLLLAASVVAAAPGVEAAGGVAAGSVEAGFGAGGIVGSFATVRGAICKGSAAPASGRSGLTRISVVVEPFDASAVLAGLGAADAICTV